jgi:transcriptional regulator with XRE-family HTH domain
MQGSAIREFRVARGMNQTKFAVLLGTTQPMVSQYETGKLKLSPEQMRVLQSMGASVAPVELEVHVMPRKEKTAVVEAPVKATKAIVAAPAATEVDITEINKDGLIHPADMRAGVVYSYHSATGRTLGKALHFYTKAPCTVPEMMKSFQGQSPMTMSSREMGLFSQLRKEDNFPAIHILHHMNDRQTRWITACEYAMLPGRACLEAIRTPEYMRVVIPTLKQGETYTTVKVASEDEEVQKEASV